MKNDNYEKLIKYQKDFPELTFDNNGYQRLGKDVLDKHKVQIKEISDILKNSIKGFVEFNNFKPRKNGSFDVRVQYYWNKNFQGVGYFNIEDFKEADRKYFLISGYYKFTKDTFEDYLVTNFDDEEENKQIEDEVFYYGMEESDIQEAIRQGENTSEDFVITSYKSYKVANGQ